MKTQAIHFVGIKGVGMAPLAVIAKEAGVAVTGSDVSEVYITDEILEKAGIQAQKGFSHEHVGQVDLVIATGAHGGITNPEVVFAKEKGIPVMMQGEAVGFFMSGEPFEREDIRGISVAGCHGKTTTTAMIATMLSVAKKDPSFVIGTGLVPSLQSSGHFGKGVYFVAEADEYATEPLHDKTTKFFWQHPSLAVVTNIEYDHPDLYPTFASLVATYKTFILRTIEEGGKVIACGDDEEIQNIHKEALQIITYGRQDNNTYVISDIEDTIGGTSFLLSTKEKPIGTFSLSVLGEHNIFNATAAIIVGLESGLTYEEIQQGLSFFTGTKRRLEFIGNTKKSAAVYDDYAHHPTEIRKTLKALKERYKDSRIICIFQPHTYSRTKLLFDEFSTSFTGADLVICTDIYSSQREPFDPSITSAQLAEAVSKQQEALYLPTLSDVIHFIQENQPDSHSIILTMGAGDVYKVGYKIVK